MPIYEYECTKCGQLTEALQRFSDGPLTKCEQCRGKLKRLISHSSFHLKGTGWYVTDYANKPSGDKVKSEKSTKSDSKKTGTEKKEAKTSKDKSKKKD